ncbi:hypothetical protein [Adlercreutzia sp. ZJ176]|nr:hypothetical protein [Adlercreutzia sp. ZJ176]
MHLLELNTVWISNNFVLTVFGGALASMLVVLVCEMQKYINAKTSTEEYIFYQALYLYHALFLMQQNICDYQGRPEACVPENLLEETTRMVQSELAALRSTDYAPLKRRNSLLEKHQDFCGKITENFQSVLSSDAAFKIAINKAKISFLQQGLSGRAVTSADEPLRTVLSIQFDRASNALGKVDEYLEGIDEYCNQRYDWREQRKQIHSSYISVFEAWDFEKEFSMET